MLLIDGHEDLAWDALVLDRDVTAPLATIRVAEGPLPAHGQGVATLSLPALRETGVRVVISTLYATPHGDTPLRRHGYHTPDEAFAQAVAQLDYYQRLEGAGEVTLIRDRESLDAVVNGTRPTPGLVLLMEGADPIREPAELPWFVERGVRLIGLSWAATRYAGSNSQPGPLTASGVELLTTMARLGVTLDVSHLAEEAFWAALDLFPGLVVASHANCRSIVPGPRQLNDNMLRAVAGRGGVIGLMLYNRFLRPGWQDGDSKASVSLTDLRLHIAHLAHIAGVECIGLGTDLDGGLGRDDIPRELHSVLDLPRIADALADAGYAPPVIAGIMGENWLRVLRGILS